MHRRIVLFVKPDYWVIFDEMDGPGEHRVESLFHFAPMRVMVDTPQRRFRADRRDMHPNLEMPLWPQCGDVDMRVVAGQTDPVQGWSVYNWDDIPIPTGIVRQTGRLPIRLAYVLYPYPGSIESGVELQAVPTADDLWACRIQHSDGSADVIACRWRRTPGNASYSLDARQCGADVALLRAGSRTLAEFELRHGDRD